MGRDKELLLHLLQDGDNLFVSAGTSFSGGDVLLCNTVDAKALASFSLLNYSA